MPRNNRLICLLLLIGTLVFLLLAGGYQPVKAKPDTPKKLKVLTFNTWLLYPLPFGIGSAQQNDMRKKIIPHAVAKTGADIVALQEVWNSPYRFHVIDAMKEYGYEVVAGDGSGILRYGSGLLIFSKYPTRKLETLVYSTPTRPDENFASKGAFKTEVKLPDIGWIDFYNTHVGAVAFNQEKMKFVESDTHERDRQLGQLAEWVRSTRRGKLQILAGDFNVEPHKFHEKFYDTFTRGYRILTEQGFHNVGLGFLDTYYEAHQEWQTGLTSTSNNPYAMTNPFDPRIKGVPNRRIDFIFMSPNQYLTVIDSKVVLTDTFSDALLKKAGLDTAPNAYSDHYGVLTTFRIN